MSAWVHANTYQYLQYIPKTIHAKTYHANPCKHNFNDVCLSNDRLSDMQNCPVTAESFTISAHCWIQNHFARDTLPGLKHYATDDCIFLLYHFQVLLFSQTSHFSLPPSAFLYVPPTFLYLPYSDPRFTARPCCAQCAVVLKDDIDIRLDVQSWYKFYNCFHILG